jgi:hypothetical protein
MPVHYRSIFPVSQQENYTQNNNVDFVMNLSNEKLVPGTVRLEGKVFAYTTGTTELNPWDRVYYDPDSGMHGLVRDVTTEFEGLGIVENLQNYPRLVKMRNMAQRSMESLGTETDNAIEGVVAHKRIAKGYLEGNDVDRSIPFSLKLNCVANKASAPLASEAIGRVRIRIRLADDNQFFFGEDSANANYKIQELRLRFHTIPDDGKRENVSLESYHSFAASLETNNQNVSTFVPGMCDSVHISFIDRANEQSSTANYLQCQPPLGKPPVGASNTSVTPKSYGLERLYYAINDTDSALVGFTMESREEIVRNGLRSFDSKEGYSTLIRRMRDPYYPDGYLVGIPFGGLIDFSQNKFAVEYQSQAGKDEANKYSVYHYFRQLTEVQA